MLTSDKREFKSRNIIKQKGHYVLIKTSLWQEDMIIINIPATEAKTDKTGRRNGQFYNNS